MENSFFFDELDDLLSQGEIEIVIERLLNFLKANENAFQSEKNTAILLSARYNKLVKDVMKGTDYKDDERVESNRLIDSISSFLSTLKKKSGKIYVNISSPKILNPIVVPSFAFEKIIGEKSNIKKIAWLQKGLQIEKSVCRVVVNKSVGTGFIIQGDWLLTNNHVIASTEDAVNAEIQFNFNEDEYGKLLTYHSYKLDISQFITNKDLDFSRVKIIDNPDYPLANWGYLRFSEDSPKVNDHVTIIQHPEGGPKQITLTDNKVINLYQHYIQYTTDTLPGSSGSPVFNDNWEVVGLHHAGGNLQKKDTGEKVFANQAISIKEILKFLTHNG